MPKYKIISVPVLIPYSFDGKSGTTVKLCACSLDSTGITKRLEVFKVSGVEPDRIPKVNSVVYLNFDQYGRITGFQCVSPDTAH